MSEHDVPAERDELRERLAMATAVLRENTGLRSEFVDDAAVNYALADLDAILALLAPQEARADDPETDGTDFAHPAYFRGKRDGIRGAVDALERVLDHGRLGGTFGDERLQAFAARLDSLRAVAQEAPPILSRKHANEIAYFLRRPDMAHDAKRERLASLVERAIAAPQGAREGELLGYVVERQLTTGEWVRVWRGSTLWFDHDEAVLERDAYALDGIPARIRPVYLGAPAPAEPTERCSFPGCGAASTGKLDGSVPLCDEHARAVGVPVSGEPSRADAAVREALDALASLFKQVLYVRERDTHGAWLPDWACAECRPDSDLIEDGFRCGFHAAKAVLSANDRLPTALGALEEGAGDAE